MLKGKPVMKMLPAYDQVLCIRTDFSDEQKWAQVIAEIRSSGPSGAEPACDPLSIVNDPEFQGAAPAEIASHVLEGAASCLIVVDPETIQHEEHPVLIFDRFDDVGRTFRAIPSEVLSIAVNLWLANMDFSDFADNTDEDGVFRGFPR